MVFPCVCKYRLHASREELLLLFFFFLLLLLTFADRCVMKIASFWLFLIHFPVCFSIMLCACALKMTTEAVEKLVRLVRNNPRL